MFSDIGDKFDMKIRWIGLGLMIFGIIGILGFIAVVGMSCYSPADNLKMWKDIVGERFELVKLSDIQQLDGRFVFGTGEIKVDNKVIFAYKNKQGDVQIGSVSYEKIKIRYTETISPYILIEYSDKSSYDGSEDLKEALGSYRFPIDYVIFCIPQDGENDFIKEWK